jgi:hypothetical protein
MEIDKKNKNKMCNICKVKIKRCVVMMLKRIQIMNRLLQTLAKRKRIKEAQKK